MTRAQTLVRLTMAALALLCGGLVSEALAHHSFAMFDMAKPVTISGVVTSFEWTNPHAYIELDVHEGKALKHWTIEMGSTSILSAPAGSSTR